MSAVGQNAAVRRAARPVVARYLPLIPMHSSPAWQTETEGSYIHHSPSPMRAWILFSVDQLRVVPVPLSPLSNASTAALSRMPLAHQR